MFWLPEAQTVSMTIRHSKAAIMVLQGNGNGTFQPAASYAAGNAPASVGVVPLDDR